MGKNLQAFVDGNGYLHGHGGFLGILKHYEAEYDNSYLNAVGESANYTGDITTDSWIDVTPSVASIPSLVTNINPPNITYLGNDVVIIHSRGHQSSETHVMPLISHDGGQIWTENTAGFGFVGHKMAVTGAGVAMSAILIADVWHMTLTEDYGATWAIKSPLPFNQSFLNSLVFAGIDGQEQEVFILGMQPNGIIAKSIDRGATWQKTNSNAMSFSTYTAINVAAGDDGLLLGYSSKLLFQSENFGLTWAYLGEFDDLMPEPDLSFYGHRMGSITLLNNNRLLALWLSMSQPSKNLPRFISDDNGISWTKIDNDGIGSGRDVAYLGNNQAIKQRADNGGDTTPEYNHFSDVYISFSTDNGYSYGAETQVCSIADVNMGIGDSKQAIYIGNGRTIRVISEGDAVSETFRLKIYTLGTW